MSTIIFFCMTISSSLLFAIPSIISFTKLLVFLLRFSWYSVMISSYGFAFSMKKTCILSVIFDGISFKSVKNIQTLNLLGYGITQNVPIMCIMQIRMISSIQFRSILPFKSISSWRWICKVTKWTRKVTNFFSTTKSRVSHSRSIS